MPGSTITLGPVTPLDQLLDALAQAPNLHGGNCVGRPDDWTLLPWGDPRRTPMARRAVRKCRSCPVLAQCAAWLAALPDAQRPHGTVTAARILPPHRNR
jgi:hypothetical protein